MSDTPPFDPAAAKAQIAAANKALAHNRAQALAALQAKVKAANLPDIAADLRAIYDTMTADKSLLLFKLHADVLGATDDMLAAEIAANDALAAG